MSLKTQAKLLTKPQIDALLIHVSNSRNAMRNRLIVLLSVRAGFRATEIANLTWSMVLNSDLTVAPEISLTDNASKGNSGRTVPMAKDLRKALQTWYQAHKAVSLRGCVISTQRAKATSAQAIVNMFAHWYRALGFAGCSSHSGRRTFITNAARKISSVGGSIRDVQALAGHASLNTTQRYIEVNAEAKRRVVDLL